MSTLSARTFCTLLAVSLTLAAGLADAAGVGFQARLQDPPRQVSAYDEHPDQFSVALRPNTYPVLDRELLFNPTIDYAVFDSSSLTFKTEYQKDLALIPITVDARRYYEHRIKLRSEELRRENFRQSLKTAKEGKGREGLSIGVALPKRFNQMFGEGGANLRVSGYRRISFSGRSQWNDNAGTGVARQSKFPSLNMEQISRFDITGTIGSKISVKVSQDNQTDIPLANRILLRYKGDEDDILQTIEAGNTTLSIPNTRFVGYSSRIQGLFGLRAEAKLGNLALTTIASQEKGSSESSTVSATGSQSVETIRDYSYVEARVFDLGYPDSTGIQIGKYDTIVTLYMYIEDTRQQVDPDLRVAVLMIDPTDSTKYTSSRQQGSFKRVEDEPVFLYDSTFARCPIAVVLQNSKRYSLGVYMEIARRNASLDTLRIDTIGNVTGLGSEDEPDTLMYLFARDKYTSHPTWGLMWRNCYRIPTGITIDDIDMKISKGLVGKEETSSSYEHQIVAGRSQGTYMEILGLDRQDRTGGGYADGELDDDPKIFRPDLGLLIFPEREPFNSTVTFTDSSNNETAPLYKLVPDIYYYTGSTQKIEASEYYLAITSQARSSVIRLGRANVIEGSERVTVNGRVLAKDQGYRINYDFGQVTMIDDEGLEPDADVKVDFQYAPFLSIQKKTLLGMRAEYEFSRDLQMGTTLLYKSDKAQDRKPRVGQETATATVMDFDVALTLHPNFLTDVVDALPLVSTEVDSDLKISAEVAQSRPNPNIDGVAYIDDFEGAVELLSAGISRNMWQQASKPVAIYDAELSEAWTEGTIRWHNPNTVPYDSVYNGKLAAGQSQIQPLRIIFRPHPQGDCPTDAPTKSWGGIMRPMSGLDEDRVRTFEFRARGGKGTIHLDFGRFVDDLNNDNRNNNEDLNTSESLDSANGVSEDVGLDTLDDKRELSPCRIGTEETPDYHFDTLPDPAGDNWWAAPGIGKGAGTNSQRPPVPSSIWNSTQTNLAFGGRTFRQTIEEPYSDHWLLYDWLNGTEGNWLDDAVVGIPDEEALYPSAGLETQNAYVTVAVPLDPLTSRFIVPGSEKNGWYTYQIPLREPGVIDTVAEVGVVPSWAEMEAIRVWFEKDSTFIDGIDSLASIDSILIASWGFVQSNWQDTLIQVDATDTLSEFLVASVSEQDSTFSAPPGVEAYEDQLTGTVESQRGLALVYKYLPPGDSAFATKNLLAAESYSGYRTLEMYVHGDEGLSDDSIMFFFRVGLDSLNYYQFHTLIQPGWAASNHVYIDFNDITALKDAVLRDLEDANGTVDTTDGEYRVVGRPNISQVRYLQAGLVNIGHGRDSGRIWLDELRVGDVRKDVGTAARIQFDGKLADLINYGFSYEHQDPYFRGISQATRGGSDNNLGSGEETNSYNYSAGINLHKFMPRSWGASLPVKVSLQKTEEIPLLRTNSDIVLPDSIREQEKSTSETYRFSVSEKFDRKGAHPVIDVLLNRQDVSVTYNRQIRTSVTNPYTLSETFNVNANYEMGTHADASVPIFFWTRPVPVLKKAAESRLSLWPSQWRWTASYARSLRVRDDQDYKRTSSFTRTLDGKVDLQYAPFKPISTNFTMSTKRDLTDPETVHLSLKDPRLGIENNYQQSFRTSYAPAVFSWLSHDLTYSVTYGDSYDRTNETRATNLTRNWSVSGDFRHQTLLGGESGRRSGSGARPQRGGVEAPAEGGKPFYQPVLAGMRFLTGWMNPFTYEYSTGFSQAIPGALTKPPWSYRLGLSTSPDFPTGSSTRSASASENLNYGIRSGFGLFGGITTTVGFRRTISRDLIVTSRARKETLATNWPEMTINIQKFTFLPLVKEPVNWFIGVFTPRTAYSRQISETRSLDSDMRIGKSETVSRSPLLSLNLRIMKALSFTGSYALTKSTEDRHSEVNGVRQSVTRSVRKSLTGSAKYSFTAPGGISIPLFGKLKFKSTVSIDIGVKYDLNTSETSKSDGPFVIATDQSSFSVNPRFTYAFSRQIQGGLTARWQDNNDARLNRKSHTREIQIWTEIQF